MDESILRNLDTQHRLTNEIERNVDALAEGGEASPPTITVPSGQLSYQALTEANDQVRAERGWTSVDLDAALTAEQHKRFTQWQMRQRTRWDVNDLLIVGFAAVIGAAATWFDMDLDKAVAAALSKLKDTDFLQRWDQEAQGLAIDYTGPGFGGPAHRFRSAGHDLARPLAALRQIRSGEFRGTAWSYGIKSNVSLPGFRQVDTWAEALVLWLKHLVADVVTPMSLPLPGMTFLYQLNDRDIRKLAHHLYEGDTLGTGLNVRSGALTPSLSVLSTETIIRTHVHASAYLRLGTLELTPADRVLQRELLLAAHSLVGAASVGKVVMRGLLDGAGPLAPTDAGLLALRHLDVPVMLRIGCLALSVVNDAVDRQSSATPSWEELLSGCVQPWQLKSAQSLEQTAVRLWAIGDGWPLP